MKHLILDSAPAIGETWEAMLQRFAEKVQQANEASILIDALTTPHISAPLGQDPTQYQNRFKARRLTNNSTVNNRNLSNFPTSASTAPTLEIAWMPLVSLISVLSPAVIGKYYFTAGEQAFYKSENFDDQPKKCKQCRRLAKASSPPSTSTAPSTQTDAAPATPNAKDLWASSGRTWPLKPSDFPKGKPPGK